MEASPEIYWSISKEIANFATFVDPKVKLGFCKGFM